MRDRVTAMVVEPTTLVALTVPGTDRDMAMAAGGTDTRGMAMGTDGVLGSVTVLAGRCLSRRGDTAAPFESISMIVDRRGAGGT